MKLFGKKVLTLITFSMLILGAISCNESKTENAIEDAGEAIEETADDAKEQMEEAGDEIGDSVDNAAENTEDAAEEMTDGY